MLPDRRPGLGIADALEALEDVPGEVSDFDFDLLATAGTHSVSSWSERLESTSSVLVARGALSPSRSARGAL
ncbi:MAG: hypothetical protein WB239_08450 [Acidimicrobiia bacterium]